MLQVSLLTLVVWCLTVKYFFTRHYVTPLGNAWGVVAYGSDIYIAQQSDWIRKVIGPV